MAQPFVYSPYSSPQSGTIAELMLQRGAIDANRATAVANAVAQNQRANGQIAGGIAQAIGQGVGAISQVPEQQRQLAETQKRQAMADEANQLELNDRKAAAKSRNTIEAALADQSNYKPDGTPDDDKIAAFLKKNDVGAWQAWQQQSAQAAKSRMDLIKSATEIAASDATTQEKTQAAQKIRTDYLGSQAYDAGKQLAAHPDDAMHIRDAFLGRAGADKMISPDDFRALSMQLATAKPDQLGSVLETFVPGEMKAKLDKEYAETGKQAADTVKANADAEKARAEAAQMAAGGPLTPEPSMVFKDAKGVERPVFTNKKGQAFINQDGTMVDVSSKLTRPTPASVVVQNNSQSVNNVKDTVQGMMDGTLPPILPGRATKEYIELTAEAKRRGFNLSGAVTDWVATQKHVQTLNGAQQLRLNQSINALPELLDSVDTLASKWKGGQFPILNKANLALAKGGAYGKDVASIANQLDSQIADVVADLGNVYMGGNSPTDHALGLAAKSLNSDWSEKVLHDMVQLAKSNVGIRRNSINNTGVSGASEDNKYAAPPAAGAKPPTKSAEELIKQYGG